MNPVNIPIVISESVSVIENFSSQLLIDVLQLPQSSRCSPGRLADIARQNKRITNPCRTVLSTKINKNLTNIFDRVELPTIAIGNISITSFVSGIIARMTETNNSGTVYIIASFENSDIFGKECCCLCCFGNNRR